MEALDKEILRNGEDYSQSEEARIDSLIARHEATPSIGPWSAEYVDQQPDEFGHVDPHEIQDATGGIVGGSYRKVDAQLMAAAPDLLEACKQALAWIVSDDFIHQQDAEDVLRQAIRKATQQ
jgi:hypothetical protein